MNLPAEGGAKRQSAAPPNPADPSQWYLPSKNKGTWLGKEGASTFRLKTPIKVNGKLVHEIRFKKGLPVLDKFILPGKSVAVILTGDRDADLRNAKVAWQKANPGKPLPPNSTFHHDLLHVTEQTVIIDGKKTKVLVGKMHLVPTKINRAVFHEGSASLAKKYYQAIDANRSSIMKLAKDEAALTGKAGTVVARAVGQDQAGQDPQGDRLACRPRHHSWNANLHDGPGPLRVLRKR